MQMTRLEGEPRPDRYGAGRKSPIGLGGAIAVHLAAVGVFLMMPPELVEVLTNPPIQGHNVPLSPPPPEVVPESEPKVQPKADVLPPQSRPDNPEPFVTLPPDGGHATFGPGSAGTLPAELKIEPVLPEKAREPLLVEAVPDPRYRRDFQPAYPPAMQRAQEEGKVTVRVTIGANGRVVAVERLFASTDAFWEATRDQALRKWRFRPATRDGAAVEATRVMTVHFQLED